MKNAFYFQHINTIGGVETFFYELAKKYYPKLWDEGRLRSLVAAGKLTPAEFKEITGIDY